MPAFIDEQRENLVTLLALSGAWSPFPSSVGALMMFHQIASLLFDTNLSDHLIYSTRVISSVYNNVRSSDQALFFPLRAKARFPALTTHIAELSPIQTG